MRSAEFFGVRVVALMGMFLGLTVASCFAGSDEAFSKGVEAYRSARYVDAAKDFRAAMAETPASGTLVNLGLTEWRRGRAGPAVLAWEQAQWVDPFDARARGNLLYARQLTGVEAPDYSWYERTSTWLPVNGWAWISLGGLWLAISMAVLPRVLRWRHVAWPQALGVMGLAVFLASLPAHFGVATRTQLGFILQKDTRLRLTPTSEGEARVKLAAGLPARQVRTQGEFVLIRTSQGQQGWVEREQFGLVCVK